MTQFIVQEEYLRLSKRQSLQQEMQGLLKQLSIKHKHLHQVQRLQQDKTIQALVKETIPLHKHLLFKVKALLMEDL